MTNGNLHIPAFQHLVKGVKKGDLLMELLDEHLVPLGITYNRPEGGLFIWATLPEKYDMNAFCTETVKRKVALVPGNAFSADESAVSHCFRMNFSTPTDEQIVKGVQILGKAAREILK